MGLFGLSAEVEAADVALEAGQTPVPEMAFGVELGVDQALEGVEAALDEAFDPVGREQGALLLGVVLGQVGVVLDLGGDEDCLSAGVLEFSFVQFAPDEPALEPARVGVGGGHEPALGLGRVSEASEQHLGGFFGHFSGFVDEHGAVLLGAESGPVGEVAEVDGRRFAWVLEAADREGVGGRTAALDGEVGVSGADAEELAHGRGVEVGEGVAGEQDVVARVEQGGVQGELSQGARLAAAHGAAVPDQSQAGIGHGSDCAIELALSVRRKKNGGTCAVRGMRPRAAGPGDYKGSSSSCSLSSSSGRITPRMAAAARTCGCRWNSFCCSAVSGASGQVGGVLGLRRGFGVGCDAERVVDLAALGVGRGEFAAQDGEGLDADVAGLALAEGELADAGHGGLVAVVEGHGGGFLSC